LVFAQTLYAAMAAQWARECGYQDERW